MAPRVALLGVCRRSIEHISKMLTLLGSSGNQLLLLSLNLGLLLPLNLKGFGGELAPMRRGYEGAAFFSVRRGSVEHISKMLTLRGSGGN